jgi:hypothetical protein
LGGGSDEHNNRVSARNGKKLLERAAATGREVSEFVREAVEKSLQKEITFAEIVAPIRRGFEESGMTDEEVDALLEDAIQEAREEKRKARS